MPNWLHRVGALATGPVAHGVGGGGRGNQTGTKPDYPTGTVALTTASWTLADALVGTDAADHRNGLQAVRLQQAGTPTMNFCLPDGVATVTVQHGPDGSSWELWMQAQCDYAEWTKVGPTVLTTSPALQVVAFAVNILGPAKFEIRKISGGRARLDTDDFTVTDYGIAPPAADNSNLALGNPSGTQTDVATPIVTCCSSRSMPCRTAATRTSPTG